MVLLILLSGSARELEAQDRFTFFTEIKLHYRDSDELGYKINAPLPPDLLPPGQSSAYLRTPDPGSHLEVSHVILGLDAQLAEQIEGRVLVRVLDLYNRNPTSMDDRIFLREAWIRFGKLEPRLRPVEPGSWFVTLGRAPRFARQSVRHLESYGLWGTAVNRFEIAQLQAGVSLGSGLYTRFQAGLGAPLFFRDPNALAGDNGTPERAPGNVAPIYESGFPILYDARPENLSLDGELELGGGLGWRWSRPEVRRAVDMLAWYFRRDLEQEAEIEGSYYGGDLDLLLGAGWPLPFRGTTKHEAGLNLEWRVGRWLGFAQYVNQEIAELGRDGLEIEMAYHVPLPGLFAVGDHPVGTWLRPAVRYSEIDNHFQVDGPFLTPSTFWDWRKLDVGLRLGIVRDADLTIEYSRHDMIMGNGRALHPDELLATLTIAWSSS